MCIARAVASNTTCRSCGRRRRRWHRRSNCRRAEVAHAVIASAQPRITVEIGVVAGAGDLVVARDHARAFRTPVAGRARLLIVNCASAGSCLMRWPIRCGRWPRFCRSSDARCGRRRELGVGHHGCRRPGYRRAGPSARVDLHRPAGAQRVAVEGTDARADRDHKVSLRICPAHGVGEPPATPSEKGCGRPCRGRAGWLM